MRHPDQEPYERFCTKSRLHKSVSTLQGIVEGITSDNEVNAPELQLLIDWMELNSPLQDLHPFNEFYPLLARILDDGVLDEGERQDLLWLSNRILRGELEAATKTDMQILHGLLQGIIADGKVLESELRHLGNWIESTSHLKGIWPYDEIESLICDTLRDGVIDDSEHHKLLAYLSDFCEMNPTGSPGEIKHVVSGICAVCPDVRISGKSFCLTGSITGYRRRDLELLIESAGGNPLQRVTLDLDYLVVGMQGNPCWAFACYGRKVEHAMQLRRAGSMLSIVHESDFFDAMRDAGIIST